MRGLEEFEYGNLENTKNIHAVLSTCLLPCDCIVYRGTSIRAFGQLQQLEDEKWIGEMCYEKGFLSTSLDKTCAFDGEVIMEIHAHKNDNALYVGYVSSAGHTEEEVLFDCGQLMRIIDVKNDEIGRKRVVIEIV